MGKYSVSNNPKVDIAIQKRLDYIVDEITNRIDAKIRAIILTGGFGRGEGGVIKENDEYTPVNDFDIGVLVSTSDYLFRRKKLQTNLSDLVHDLSSKVGVKQIDAGISHFLAFKFAPNLVNWYEVLHGHKILFGDININEIMPNLTGENLPLLDGAIYFLSRGSGLLIPALYFLPDYKISKKHRQNFQIEVDKACMAMGDTLLLLKQRYHYSYAERKKRILPIDISEIPEGNNIKKMYIKAVEQKLHPHFDWQGDEEMINHWFKIRDIFGEFFLWFESKRLNFEFKDWLSYSFFVQKNVKDPIHDLVRNLIKYSFYTINKKHNESSKKFNWSVMPTLLFSLNNDGSIKKDLLNRTEELINVDNNKNDVEAWIKMVTAYLGIFHPQGVIKELIEGKKDI